MELKAGQVMLCNWDNPYAKLIRLRNFLHTKSFGWSHAAIIGNVDLENEEVLVYEAVNKGFVSSIYPIYFIQRNIESGKILIGESKKELKSVKETCDKYFGRGYAWQDIFGIMMATFLGKKLISKFDSAKHLICSEAVARILYDASGKKIDFVKEFGKSYDLITPQDLRNSEQITWQTV